MSRKTIWQILLVLSLILFFYGLFNKSIIATIISLILALVVNYKGKETLFLDFDKNQKKD